MIKSCLLIAVAVASVASVKVDWNSQFEEKLEELNEMVRERGDTTFDLQGGKIAPEVELKKFTIVGLDSLMRTGQCTKSTEGKKTTYDYHAGLRMLVGVFPSIIIEGQEMSAFVRVKNNSVHLRFSVVKDRQCKVYMEQMEVVNFNGVEFGASRAEFDGMDVEVAFQNQVRAGINEKMHFFKSLLEKQLTNSLCKQGVSEEAFLDQVFSEN